MCEKSEGIFRTTMRTTTIKSKKHGIFTIKYSNIDHELIMSMQWHIHKTTANKYYARNRAGTMHRLIMGCPEMMVDHKNGDTLDNSRENLRLATASQNQMNSRKSKYKGVDYVKSSGKFRARITVKGSVISGGYFNDQKSAALRYNYLAIKFHGEFASLNKL